MTNVIDEVAGRSVAPGKEVLLSLRNVRAGFNTDDGRVQAIDGVSFDVARGEVFAIVGESGSGKSVTAMSILGLQPTLDITQGEIFWKGRDLLTLPEDERRRVRGKEIAMIFQDPLTSLNPVHTVGKQIAEMARIHEGATKKQAFERSVELLDLVGIPEPRERARMYPHEFSGGMRQRAMIAMAITCNPDLLIADEPTTALDVTVQAQVLEVLIEIKDEIDSAIILITHDLGVVAGLAHRIMVMYAGRAVELGTTREVFYEPRHPYTLGLLASLPRLDDAHMSACHYAEELAEVSIESLRQSVDLTAEEELLDIGVSAPGPNGEENLDVEPTDVFVEEGIAHQGVVERSLEGERPDTRPGRTHRERGEPL
jgi:ABC-type dipeptide/oligopeptide/nickel transport system ATPase component